VDMGKGPTSMVSHHLINIATNEHTFVNFNGSPCFYSISLGVNYKLW